MEIQKFISWKSLKLFCFIIYNKFHDNPCINEEVLGLQCSGQCVLDFQKDPISGNLLVYNENLTLPQYNDICKGFKLW